MVLSGNCSTELSKCNLKSVDSAVISYKFYIQSINACHCILVSRFGRNYMDITLDLKNILFITICLQDGDSYVYCGSVSSSDATEQAGLHLH
jgi:hypothetical protein